MNNIKNKISKWWRGEVYKNDPNDNIVFIGIQKYRTSVLAHKIYNYCKKEYRFIIGIILAAIAIFLTYFLSR